MPPRELPKERVAPFSFPGHLLSKKLLSFRDYPENNAYSDDINVKVARHVYGDIKYSPIYYSSLYSSDPSETLDNFISSSEFNIFITELKTCFESITNWMLEKKIVFKLQQNGRELTGYSILHDFLERLQGDTFAEHRAQLYSDGKRNLEIIVFLIKEERISLEFRKEVIVSMLEDNSFERCSGACLTALSDAADKLKKYNDFLPTSLIKLFILALSREVALSNSLSDHRSYSAILCTYVGCFIQLFEIHAVHYLCGRLKRDLSLSFLTLPQDPYIDLLKTRLYGKAALSDRLYSQYFDEFQRRFHATSLVKFISYQLYEGCLVYLGNYSSLQAFIENQLTKLGKDSAFSWSEIFTEAGGLKTADDFMIPIAERLLNSGWLTFPNQVLESENPFFTWFKNILGSAQSASKRNFRIYPNNILLSWVKKEDRRQAIVDVLATAGGFEWLNRHIFSDPEILKDLLQSMDDLIFFFRSLPVSQHLSALEKLDSIDFDISSTLVDKLDGTINFIEFHRLFTALSKSGREFFVSKHPKLVYSILHDILEQVEHLNNDNVLLMINSLIRRVIRAGFLDFSGIHFKARDLSYEQLKKDDDEEHQLVERKSYLNRIDFSGTNLSNVIFNEPIIGCIFNHVNLQGAAFIDTRIDVCGFSHANLLNCKFDSVFMNRVLFVRVNLNNTNFLNSNLIRVIFHRANLNNINFLQTELIGSSFRKSKVSALSFKKAEFLEASFESTQLNRVNFNDSELLGVSFRGSDLNEVDFSASELVCVGLEKSIITNIILSVSQLHQLYKKGVTDFSKVHLADNGRNELISPADRIKFFSRVIESSNRQHFFCCDRRNFRCFSKEPLTLEVAVKKGIARSVLLWKYSALEKMEQYPFKGLEPNPLEKKLLEKKWLETQVLENDLLGRTVASLETLKSTNQNVNYRSVTSRRLLARELEQGYSNDHESPRMHIPPRRMSR